MDGYPSNVPIAEQSYRRFEVLSGTPRRRRWSAEEKARIVAESSAPGAVARTVALRHGVHPNQLYGWRRELGVTGGTAEPGRASGFVPVWLANKRRSGTEAWRARWRSRLAARCCVRCRVWQWIF